MRGDAVHLLGTPENRAKCTRHYRLPQPIETGHRMVFLLCKIVNLCIFVVILLLTLALLSLFMIFKSNIDFIIKGLFFLRGFVD